MIPEERFNKIEALLQTTAERQGLQQEQLARFSEEMEKQHVRQQEQFNRFNQLIEKQHTHQQAQLGRFGQDIEKQNEGIRALIVVGRTCLDSIRELRESMQQEDESLRESIKELRNAQAATEEKLNILIDTVDRIIPRRNGKQ